MKVSGKMIKEMEKGDAYILMEIFIQDTGKIIKNMEMELFNIQMDPNMKANSIMMK